MKQTAYDPRRDGVTFSLLAKWLDCSTKARHTLERWSPAGFYEPSLYGTLVHDALQHLHTCEHDGFVVDDLLIEETVPQRATVLLQEFGGTWNAEEQEKWELIQVRAIPVLKVYFDLWAKENARINWQALEHEFAVEFEGVTLRGKIDGVLTRAPGKKSKAKTKKETLWVFETKTRGALFADNLLMSLARDLQANIYLLALRLEGRGWPHGLIYNEIRKPQLRLKQNETWDEFEARIEAHAREKHEDYFSRTEVALSRSDLQEFEESFRRMIREFLAWCDAGMPGYKFGMPCVGKYGPCPFMGLCFEDSTTGLVRREKLFTELDYDA